jgi:hypothetical protein
MRTHETIILKGAVVITKQALEDLNRILEQIAGSLGLETAPIPEYSGSLSDGTIVEFDSFSELAHYPNRSSRRLVRLTAKLETPTETSPQEAFKLEVVVLASSKSLAVISIDGDQKDSLHAREVFTNVTERMRAGYRWMYLIPDPVLGFFFLGSLVGAFPAWLLESDAQFRVKHAADMVKINPALDATKKAVADAQGWNFLVWGVDLWIWALILAAIVFVLSVIRDTHWPKLVFEIGQEIDRSNARKERRKWIVVALVLGVPVALLTRFIGSRLGI